MKRKKLKVFAESTVTEIQDAETGKAIVSWPGFDDSDIPLDQHRRHAADLVRSYNAYPNLLENLELAVRYLEHPDVLAVTEKMAVNGYCLLVTLRTAIREAKQ